MRRPDDAYFPCLGQRPAMQDDLRGASSLPHDLYFTPADAPYASAERLHNRFLGCEPARQLRRPAAAVSSLTRRVNLLQESLRVTLCHLRDPVDFYNVDARVNQRPTAPSSPGPARYC